MIGAVPLILSFHGIGRPQRALDHDEPPYWIPEDRFHRIVDRIVHDPVLAGVQLTFDDGNSSDYAIAFPRLGGEGLSASFFVLAGRLNVEGYLTAAQLHEMASAGMEVGLHGMHHVDWTAQDDARLSAEIGAARSIIEAASGRPVTSVAVPKGRYDYRVLRRLKAERFRRIYTSDGAPRLFPGKVAARLTVTAGNSSDDLERMFQKTASLWSRSINEIRYRVKSSRFLLDRDGSRRFA